MTKRQRVIAQEEAPISTMKSHNYLDEMIERAEKRIDELRELINFWKKQKEKL